MKKFARLQNVTVAGRRVKSASQMVNPDDIRIGDKPLPYGDNLSIVLHKPRGYVTSRKKEGDNKIIYDLLPTEFFNRKPLLVAAGRLDKWASGLVVLSQDHKFVQRLAAPKVRAGALGKVYHVQLMNDLTGNETSIFASGKLMLRSETKELKPAKIEIIDPQEKLVQMTLYEGRYHQIRRMLAAVKNKAVSIHRVQVGPISLGNLPIGHWRALTPQEIEKVWKQSPTASTSVQDESNKQEQNSSADASSATEDGKTTAQASARVPLRKSLSQVKKTKKKMQKLKQKREERRYARHNAEALAGQSEGQKSKNESVKSEASSTMRAAKPKRTPSTATKKPKPTNKKL